jgi:hypothetical protein
MQRHSVGVVCWTEHQEGDDTEMTVMVKITGLAAKQATEIAERLEHPIRLVVVDVYREAGWRQRRKH